MITFRSSITLIGLLTLVLGAAVLLAFSQGSASPKVNTLASLEGVQATLYKTPTCACCGGHAEALEQGGMTVTTIIMETPELMRQRAAFDVPHEVLSCHVTAIEGYAVEGHVPLAAISQLLSARPDIDGIALPGMPAGSPGMAGLKSSTWDIMAFKDGNRHRYLLF